MTYLQRRVVYKILSSETGVYRFKTRGVCKFRELLMFMK